MKRVFIVHGWGGNSNEPWFLWIKKELEEKGYEVNIPEMPDSDNPKIEPWVSKLSEVVGNPDEETYFIGHSIGCQTIMRYLEAIDSSIGGVVFVAGWFNLKEDSYEEDEDREVAKPWIETPIDFEKVKSKMNGNVTTLFSDNDRFVSLDDSELFKERFNAKIIVEHEKGHFDPYSGIKEVPSALQALLEMLK